MAAIVSVPFNDSKYVKDLVSPDLVATNASAASVSKNKDFIFQTIEPYLEKVTLIFEVGSGIGLHAAYFSEKLPHVVWQTSDQQIYHSKILQTLQESGLQECRLKKPVVFDIDSDTIDGQYDAVYASNVVHCIPKETEEKLFAKASTALKVNGLFILYGPYNVYDPAHIEGKYTSKGNQAFDQKLKNQDSRLGLREIGEMTSLAEKNSFRLIGRHLHQESNNYLLVFKKV